MAISLGKYFNFIALILCFLCLGAFEEQESRQIFQTGIDIRIDGNLEDWGHIQDLPVNLNLEGEEVPASSDLKVSAKFSYDSKHFLAAVKAVDDQFEFPNRSWRYGDGLCLTFLDPYQGNESYRFSSFGFSLEGEEATRIFLNRDGEYFPDISIREIQASITVDAQNRTLVYEIAIPWKILFPFKPFFHKTWGINLIYVDNDANSREILQLFPDREYDSEHSSQRKGEIFSFINHIPQEPEFQSTLNASHFYHDEEKSLASAINSPDDVNGWKIRYELSSAKKHLSAAQDIKLQKGLNITRFNLEKDRYPTGVYDLSLGVISDKGALKYSDNHTFFILNREKFQEILSQVSEIKNSSSLSHAEKIQDSLPSLEIRLKWIREFMDEAPPYADIKNLREWNEEAIFLKEGLNDKKPAVFPPGNLGRMAHRSKIDGTLQPYSVYIPESYDHTKSMPLFVTLHGSGVDERRAAYNIVRVHVSARSQRKISPMIILAPQARGLSDFYTGKSGQDVIECIRHIQSLYNIDKTKIILDGFAMGGYGAWRIGLLHPELFRAVIIRSGAITPPPSLQGENILELLKIRKAGNLLIVHGDKDNAVPVENARRAVKTLIEMGIKHKYLEVKGAAHGNYDKWDEIFNWLRMILR